ncbi:hypothetical protein SSBG_00431 [Streptomyces sp. SPB074]|nr:hypothetical protein SSBG_00431 [Streptomyces sp. SPB074]
MARLNMEWEHAQMKVAEVGNRRTASNMHFAVLQGELESLARQAEWLRSQLAPASQEEQLDGEE